MATTFHAASIAEKDYLTFRTLLYPNLPNTYDEWRYLRKNQMTNLVGKGHAIENVEIKPDEFRSYLATHQADGNIDGLDRFVAWKRAQGKT